MDCDFGAEGQRADFFSLPFRSPFSSNLAVVAQKKMHGETNLVGEVNFDGLDANVLRSGSHFGRRDRTDCDFGRVEVYEKIEELARKTYF